MAERERSRNSDNGGGVGGVGGTASPMDGGLAGQVHSDGSVGMADVGGQTPRRSRLSRPRRQGRCSVLDAGCSWVATAGRCDAGVEIPTAGLYLWLSADVGVQIAGGQVTSLERSLPALEETQRKRSRSTDRPSWPIGTVASPRFTSTEKIAFCSLRRGSMTLARD